MNYNRKFLFFMIHLFFIQLYAFTCHSGAGQKNGIPDSIIQKIGNFIRAEVGDEYFKEFVSFNPSKSFFRKSYRITHPTDCAELLKEPHYFLTYKIKIPDMGEDMVTIEFITDTSGDMISECYIDKIPNCPNNDCWGYFPKIKKDEAIEIAKQAGLDKGLKDWMISFQFYFEDFNNYVWSIKNYLSFNNPNKNESRTSGEVIYISAIDGAVVQRNYWAVIP